MYAYIKGLIVEKREDNLVLENNGIGYNIQISSGTMAALPPVGAEVKIYTYTSVREDAFLLFGFLTKEDLDMFRQVITVGGIGPKGGLAILSCLTAQDLKFAIVSGDAKRIAKAPGIGARTAERLILELKDKIDLEETIEEVFAPKSTGSAKEDPLGPIRLEVQQALTSLGYSASDALRAVTAVEADADVTVEQMLKLALIKMY